MENILSPQRLNLIVRSVARVVNLQAFTPIHVVLKRLNLIVKSVAHQVINLRAFTPIYVVLKKIEFDLGCVALHKCSILTPKKRCK